MLRFLKDWTLPVAIVLGTLCYLLFYYVPALDAAGNWFGPVFDVIFPFFVDRYSGMICKVYNGLNPIMTEFDPLSSSALSFAG